MVIQVHRYNITQGAGFYSAAGSASDCRSRGQRFDFQPGSVEIDHEIISTVIHPLPLISRKTVVSYWRNITKTYLYNFDPLKPQFYMVKLGFTGVHIIFLISAQKHRLWVLVRTASARRF